MSTLLNIFSKDSSTKEDNESCFPNMTYKERLTGFGICFVIGFVIQISSFGSFTGILTGNPERFAITFSLGNIISLIGSGFLIGPLRQIKQMMEKTRIVTSGIYITSIVMVLVSALVFQNALLTVLFLVVEIVSYVWYIASYIPFARSCLRNCFRKVADMK